MTVNSALLRPIGIAAGILGSVSFKNNVAFTCFKHLGISTVKVAKSVKSKLFLLYRTSVYPFSCISLLLGTI